MGLYNDKLLPRVIDKVCGTAKIGVWRRRCLEGASGVVVEPGFGSGTNLPYYPHEVTKVYAVDPAVLGRRLAADRIRESSIEVEFVGLDGQRIPLDTDSCDTAVLTFTLCTIPDPTAALAELRRVVKSGGKLHFVEHGRAPTASMVTWQERIDPVQRRLADGCHLSRDIPALITDAGFELDWSDARYAEASTPWSYFHLGVATNR